MPKTIKLTSKRQATLPAELCKDLALEPGDEIELCPVLNKGKPQWIMQKRELPVRHWQGTLRKYADGVSNHSIDAIRESILKGRDMES